MSNFSFLQEQNEYSMFAASAIEAEKVYATSTTIVLLGVVRRWSWLLSGFMPQILK